jgi:hypothetical protein
MPYVPDATNVTQPTDTLVAPSTAAAEFRAIKVKLATKMPVEMATAAYFLTMRTEGPSYSFLPSDLPYLTFSCADSTTNYIFIGATGVNNGLTLATRISTVNQMRFFFGTDGRMSGTGLHNNANGLAGTTKQYIGSGIDYPTGAVGSNCAVLAMNRCQWTRTGNIVSVTGSGNVTCTTPGVQLTFWLPIPVASNLAVASDLSGVASVRALGAYAFLTGDISGDRAGFTCYWPSGTTQTVDFSYQYEVL